MAKQIEKVELAILSDVFATVKIAQNKKRVELVKFNLMTTTRFQNS